MTLIKELIDIPERVHRSDYLLRLPDAVTPMRAKETLMRYVVTPQLETCFDQALGYIQGALAKQNSQATYLHGSFGCGKSHFMAILHLLLQKDPTAHAKAELAPVLAPHREWLDNTSLLLLPLHLIGHQTLESAVLRGYLDFVHHHHPEVPAPSLYTADRLFDNARQLRSQMGDNRFFAALNQSKEPPPWNAPNLESAMALVPSHETHAQLVADLVATLFPAYQQQETFLPLRQGLTLISQHSHSLGYNGVVLLLDELIHWLALHVTDPQFINQEIQKVTLLVEAVVDRPVPIISFVARQRDLRELVGDNLPGAHQISFSDTLRWWEGRFETITIEDDNLPLIIEKRVLHPKSAQAKTKLGAAFQTSTSVREDVMITLMTKRGDWEQFRRLYPFSPALLQALMALSSLLQRERTAVKVLVQLLVNQQETLELGQIIPVGDLYDVIADEAEPFTSEMRAVFDSARKLYRHKLLPMLESEHGLWQEALTALPPDDPKRKAFQADDRLLKTLLLSALVPEVECLKGLSANRLSALNFGAISSPVAGREASLVLNKCRKWASQVGEIKLGDERANPSIALHLTGVDVESILEKARTIDNSTTRVKKVRDMVFDTLGIGNEANRFAVEYPMEWRGTQRTVDLLFVPLRELRADLFHGDGKNWQVIMGLPFDEEGKGLHEAVTRIQNHQAKGDTSNTILWLPSCWNRETQRELGKLVIMEHILASEDRFRTASVHLTAVERAGARNLMEQQQEQLRAHLQKCLEGAYGLSPPLANTLDETQRITQHLYALNPSFQPQLLNADSFSTGFKQLLEQGLAHQFPTHPFFEISVRLTDLRRVLDEAERAMQTTDGRITIEYKPNRIILRQIANPLKLGDMQESHFVLGTHWKQHFERIITRHRGPLTVELLRQWCDSPVAMGLPIPVVNLLILIFAKQSNRFFTLNGELTTPSLESLPNELELVEQALPTPAHWEQAVVLCETLFGLSAPKMCSADNLLTLNAALDRHLRDHGPSCRQLVAALTKRTDLGASERLRTAQAVVNLLEMLEPTHAEGRITLLATFQYSVDPALMGVSLLQARAVNETLEQTNWLLLEGVWRLTRLQGQPMRDSVLEALRQNERDLALKPVLQAAEQEAVRLLTLSTQPKPGHVTVAAEMGTFTDAKAAYQHLRTIVAELQAHPKAELFFEYRIDSPVKSKS